MPACSVQYARASGAGAGMQQQRHVFLSCFDDPDRLLKVDASLFEGTRLGLVVAHQQPQHSKDGKPFWDSGLTRDTLIAAVKSLTVGQLVVPKSLGAGELIAAFEFEGISVTQRKAPGVTVDPPKAGVAFAKPRAAPVQEVLTSVCEKVADALLQWPRLEFVLDSALGMHSSKVAVTTNISATCNRCWIRFAGRPRNIDATNATYATELVVRSPRWFAKSMAAIGLLHAQLSARDPLFGSRRDEAAFKLLVEEVEAQPLGNFFATRLDYVKTTCDHKTRKLLRQADRFVVEMRQNVLAAHELAAGQTPSTDMRYAQAVVTLAENSMNTTTDCSRMFSELCADTGSSSTPERKLLAKLLKQRGAKVVRWCEERDSSIRPLIFPPQWREQQSACQGPMVLVDFSDLR